MADPSDEHAAQLAALDRTLARFAEPDPSQPWPELLAEARRLLDSIGR